MECLSTQWRLCAWPAAVLLAALLLAAGLLPASAQDAPRQPTKLEGVCRASLQRFCPDLPEQTGDTAQTRNQVICLKPYRSSLPPACRNAVTAAMR